MKAKKRWLHLCLVFCLTLGWAGSVPKVSPTVVHPDAPQPPVEEIEPVTLEASPTPPVPTDEEIELRAALDALEAASQQGPEAVVAQLETLRGRALDLVMNEIRDAQDQLARSALLMPESIPTSLAEEEAALVSKLEF